ncbi:diguanylate cyclase [Rivibacter subsaxonicus]|uniref:Diguanylate cyclase (GGDEF)-like protein n=1 Tax=Rivibacter subsaxonicus TaxID=457575 RepID=A0A4Q7W1J9_9BURK|nr:diguanylate cyclase [Rivibacter subsaxonicus]RZU02399.1 diguanylate cyclase (GGDEF)-like protein [Rivibacter subsaxonicus]
MSHLHLPWRALLGALLLAASCLTAAAAPAALVLDDRQARVEAWPAVTVMVDASGKLDLAQVLAAPERFEPPTTAYATLGLNRDATWLRIPFSVPAEAREPRVLDIEYAPLNRVDLFLVQDGRVVQQAQMGNLQPFAERPIASRTHSVELLLLPGRDYQLLLRVQTLGARILPISFNTLSAFHARALGEQMLQGLLAGLGLCLVIYSLIQWWGLRDTLYLKYAILTTASLLFSVAQFGIGAQYLWTDNLWVEIKAPGLLALIAGAGTFLFVEHVLAGPDAGRYFSRVMKGGAIFLFGVALAYALDLIDVHLVSLVVGTVVLAPALMGMPGAIRRARRGDAIGGYFLVAWAGYFVTTALMVGLIKGRVDWGFLSMHSFQIGATLDMLIFMRVIGLRAMAAAAAAEHVHRERDVLLSLAHTDPLTGLPNRRGLNARLGAALPRCSPDHMLAVYMLDLDGFKQVNDRFGHDVGDELLVAVAQRLKAHLRSSDVVARVGGDEFVVMASGPHNERQAHDLGSKLLEAFEAPFDLSRQRCSVGLTIGYVLVPHDGTDAVDLLRRADAAMYLGKQSGKNCLRRGELDLVLE